MVAADPQQMVLFHWKAARFPVDDWSLRVLTMTLLPGSVLPWQSNCWRQGRLEYDFGKFVSLQSINVLNLKCSIIECHWTVSNLVFSVRLDSKAGPSLRYHIFYLDSVQFCVSFVQPVALGTLLHLLQSFS